MVAVVGRTIPSLRVLVEVLLEGEEAQKAAFSFCEDIISRKWRPRGPDGAKFLPLPLLNEGTETS
jgi:hypothetical protein